MASSIFIGYFGGGSVTWDGSAFTFGGRLLAPDGSASAPSYSFTSDTTIGLYKSANKAIAFAESSNPRFVVDLGNNALPMRSNMILGWSSTSVADFANIDVSLSRTGAGSLGLNSGTATPAGGSTSMRLVFGSTAGFGIYIGSGVPTVSAAQGSLYLRSDGSSTTTRAYINTNGTTGWTAISTAA